MEDIDNFNFWLNTHPIQASLGSLPENVAAFQKFSAEDPVEEVVSFEERKPDDCYYFNNMGTLIERLDGKECVF